MNTKYIVVRADGGNNLGMGHIVRTSVLAKVLQETNQVVYLCDEDYKQGIEYLVQQGFEVVKTAKSNIVHAIKQEAPDILITDHYDIDQEYMRIARKYCSKLVYIDDNAEKTFNGDLIVNQNYGAECLNYKIENNISCQLLLGSQYILLGEVFRDAQPVKVKQKVQDILITVGGSDPNNLTGEILEQVKDLSYHFQVVIGGGFPYEEDLKIKYSNPNIYWHNQPRMNELMSKMDLAISSCGSTLFELGVLGVPTLGVIVADNQEGLAKRLYEQGLIHLIGKKEELYKIDLTEVIKKLAENKNLRQYLNQKNRRMFNRQGVYSVAQAILDL